MYLGHRSKDVTDLYERHEVTQYLEEDAERLRAYIKTSVEAEVDEDQPERKPMSSGL